MASPETEQIAAYAAGRAAAIAGATITSNPFSFAAGGLVTLQAQGWAAGFNDAIKDASGALLNTLVSTQRITKKFVLSNAQMLAIFTTPVQLLPGIAGQVIVPYECQGRKLAGAYTIGTMSALNFLLAAVTLARATTLAGWLDQATEQTDFLFGPGAATVLPDLGSVTALAGLPLNVQGGTANPTGAGGAVELNLTYRYVPLVGLATQ